MRLSLDFGKNCLLVTLLFFSLANTMISFPIDKLSILLLALTSGWLFEKRLVFNFYGAFNVTIITALITLSCSLSTKEQNLDWQNILLLIFFIIAAGLLTTSTVKQPANFLNACLIAIAIYLVFGIIAWIYSSLNNKIFYVMPLYGKGRPDIYAALSFATTPQVFSTVAALAAVIALSLKKAWILTKNKKQFICRYDFMLLLSVAAIITSLNRVWLLFIPILLVVWWGHRALIAGALVCVIFFGFLLAYGDIAFTFGTVSSRLLMIEHMMAFFDDQNAFDLFVGRPFFNGPYFHMDGQDFYYIESAPVFLIAKFGILGFISTIPLVILWLYKLYRTAPFLAFFSFYYLVFAQIMTHEFFSISFWLYWVIITCLYYERKQKHMA